MKTCSSFHFEGRGAGLQLVTGWHRGNAGKRGVAFTAGAANVDRGGAKGKAQTETCVLQVTAYKDKNYYEQNFRVYVGDATQFTLEEAPEEEQGGGRL